VLASLAILGAIMLVRRGEQGVAVKPSEKAMASEAKMKASEQCA
jgi:hypothetical protein